MARDLLDTDRRDRLARSRPIEKRLDPTLSKVEVVPQDIARVLLNLLNNAFYAVNQRRVDGNGLDYIPEVRVTSRFLDGRVEVQVEDNGPGIPEDVRARIFEPFFTTKPTGEGTGLGLSLSHEIVAQGHGGSLTVKSRAGSGATFVISIPA